MRCISCKKEVTDGELIIGHTGQIMSRCTKCINYWKKFNRIKQKQLREGTYKNSEEIEKLLGDLK